MLEGVVVLGVSRTGTTLMRRVLDAHPSVAAPAETCVLSASARFLDEQRLMSGAEFGVLGGLRMAGFDDDEVLRRLRELAFSFFADYAAAQGKPLWASKTATDVFHLPAIERLCGDRVRYIGMVRHGLDTVCSMQELVARVGGYFDELHAYVQREHRPLIAMARAWVDATSALLDLAARRPEQAHLVRYEDLVGDPEPTLDALAAFLELPRPEGWAADVLQPPSSAGFGDWKTWETRALHSRSIGRHRELDVAARSALLEVVGPTLEAAGYGAHEPPLDAAGARRRAERAMQLAVLRVG